MTDQLFVYGTLLRGEERDGLVLSLPVAPATVTGRLHLVPAGYPALEVDGSGPPISGELLTLESASILTLLDLVEGVADGLYSRTEVTAQTVQGPVRAWAYVMNGAQRRRANCRPLKVRDWRALRRPL
jgi:gamma-glutamylcyclotransferase (GGCT)/AIG2-like uncharacterized protein YtfP